jgi:hypothetical protein
LLGNGSANTPVARQWLSRHVIAATDMYAILEETFSVRSMPRLYNEDELPLQHSLEAAVRRVGGWLKWPPAFEDVSPGTEERPLLEDVTKQLSDGHDREH